MFAKLKQIWKILFPPKPIQQPSLPKRPEYDVDELIKRGEELKQIHNEQKKVHSGVCPNCRSNAENLVVCAKCGKTGCDYCMTFDPSERKYYCEQCW